MEQKKSTKYILIAISVLFIFVMLILPLFSILFSALKEGFAFYIQAITTEYVRSALLVTLLATVSFGIFDIAWKIFNNKK